MILLRIVHEPFSRISANDCSREMKRSCSVSVLNYRRVGRGTLEKNRKIKVPEKSARKLFRRGERARKRSLKRASV